MNRMKTAVCLLTISLYPCIGQLYSEEAALSTQPRAEVNYSLKKDGRNWKLAYEAKNDNMSIKEFTPENQTLDNWTELLTIHDFHDLSISVDKYYEAFISQLEKLAPDSKVEHRVIRKDNDSLFGEWWIQDQSPNVQHEWFRVLTNGQDVVVLRYTTKKVDDINSTRKVWEEILGNAKLPKGTMQESNK